MGGNNGCPNDENDYEVGMREERARIVAFCRMCAANNADWRGITTGPLPPGPVAQALKLHGQVFL